MVQWYKVAKKMNFRFKKAQKLKQQRDSERVRDYFDDDDEEDVLASGGVSSGVSGGVSGGVEEEEVDPLDAFMNENTMVLKSEEALPRETVKELPEIVSGWDGEGDEVFEEEQGGYVSGVSGGVECDEDGVPLGVKKGGGGVGEKVIVEALPPIDHSTIVYPPFRKDFTVFSKDTCGEDVAVTDALRKELQVRVSGAGPIPPPCSVFSGLSLSPPLLTEISRMGFDAPTPIQAQALPVVLAGEYDVV